MKKKKAMSKQRRSKKKEWWTNGYFIDSPEAEFKHSVGLQIALCAKFIDIWKLCSCIAVSSTTGL
jgi:hypothetical protein